MLRILLTLDYEIHGNGDGSPQKLMIDPTNSLLRLCDEFGAKVTIMADVAELLRFKEYKEEYGRDDYCYDATVHQLRDAINRGHDVQLHIHPSYFNARYRNGRWMQDWTEYNFAELPYERMNWMVRTCKEKLEALLRPVESSYSCVAFRAANWSVSPSHNVVQVLRDNDIKIDTSIFKYGRRDGIVRFDYSKAVSSVVPWRVRMDDMCGRDDSSPLWELPIYSEKRWVGAFLSQGRIHRAVMSRGHKVHRNEGDGPIHNGARGIALSRIGSWVKTIVGRHAWKADFNQCGSKQLTDALHRASSRFDLLENMVLPFVLIGHSKLFTRRNGPRLEPFLAHCAEHPDKFQFETLSGINGLLEQG